MGGICGWQGGLDPGHDPDTALAAQASPSVAFAGPSRLSGADRTRGLHVEGHGDECHHCAEGDVWAAIQGRPRWTDDDIAVIAARDGHGRALVTAFERLGTGLFDILDGDWALAVLDGAKGRTLLAVDRIGVRPLCYGLGRAGGLVFGTTVDSLRGHPAIDARLHHQAIFDLLYFTRIPAPHTIFEGISKLMPGHYAWRDGPELSTRPYWRPAYGPDNAADADALADELHGVLRASLTRSMDGFDHADVGAFLSGGIDSSAVVGLLSEQTSGRAKAFGVGFESEEYNEMGFARITAKHFDANLREYYVTPRDIVDILPKLAGAFDEPYGNSSAVPSYFCARMARENGIEVLLAGDGGDELFGGNERYARQKIFESYFRLPGWLRGGLLEPVLLGIPGIGRLPVLSKARNYILRAKIPLPDRLESYNFYHGRPVEEFFKSEIAANIDALDPLRILRHHYGDADASAYLDKMLFLDLRTTLADDDLRKVGRAAELAGMRVRFPLLDREMVEFSARVPARLNLKGLKLRYFFKYALRDFLAKETLAKSKHGFGLPFGEWIRTEPALQEIAQDSLSSLARRGLFQDEFLNTVRQNYQAGKLHYYGELIWVLMQLELWFQHHMDGAGK